ncbi:MAG: hypothetical protein ACKVZH_19385 [Blastocatellia bacterium]
MSSPIRKKRILLVDRNVNWLEFAAETLAETGYSVQTLDQYDDSPNSAYFDKTQPDLVILGCAKIRQPEYCFIQEVRNAKRPLIVLGASLTWDERRFLFLKGVDVADKPFDADGLAQVIEEAFDYPILEPEEKYMIKLSDKAFEQQTQPVLLT